ncbi:MAG: MFS transporter, partial [Gammaproteobacteria bacterium]|nr:MFS transporter [Gammaproteobacteria bacterium]
VLLANNSIKTQAVTAQVTQSGLSETAFLMFFFAAFALLAAAIFALYAKRYQMQDNYRPVW